MEKAKVTPKLCIGCGSCVAVCPTDAIVMEDGIARVIPDKCIGCGSCVAVCPTDAIKMFKK